MKYLISALTAMLVAATLATIPGKPAQADHTKRHTMQQAHAKTKKTVYVCVQCKTYHTPGHAKSMHYKDAMGHKLTQRRSIPAGYSNGDNMGAMQGHDSKHDQASNEGKAKTPQASSMKCPVCKTMDMTSAKTASNTQEVKIKGQTWYCCSGCDMSGVADK